MGVLLAFVLSILCPDNTQERFLLVVRADCLILRPRKHAHNMGARAHFASTLLRNNFYLPYSYKHTVHGAAKSGRVRDHHFVHTSLKLEIKDYHEAPVLSGTSAMPPALSACTSDHFLENYSNFNNVENDTPLEFVETEMSGSRGKKARKSRGKKARKSKQKKQKKQTKHNVEDRAELRGIDITKAVTSCIDVLTRVRDGIRTGLVIIDEGINTVDDYRRKLFSEEDGKVYEVMDIVKSVAETVDRIDQKIQNFKKAVTEPDSPERKELVQDIKNLAANRMKLMTKQVRKVVHFSHSYVVKMLDEFKEYPPTFMKNLKPMTDVIAKVLQVGSECDNTLRNSHSTLPNALHRHSQTIHHAIL